MMPSASLAVDVKLGLQQPGRGRVNVSSQTASAANFLALEGRVVPLIHSSSSQGILPYPAKLC